MYLAGESVFFFIAVHADSDGEGFFFKLGLEKRDFAEFIVLQD
jgi:hypothetical protein